MCSSDLGDGSANEALVYDYSTKTETWLLVTSLSGRAGSTFGASVAMEESGRTIGVGAPTSDINGSNLGEVVLYGFCEE